MKPPYTSQCLHILPTDYAPIRLQKDENVTIQVKVISNTYDSSISLISKISDAFVNFKNINITSQNEELDTVDNITMIDSNEEFYEESFIQTIIINI
ncbi:MAG: hypothetical protein IIV67_01105, partial [Bacteroidaceae bacterium]|nr:hypothetical protein [Bacteroidaceae bacterium]